MNLSPIAQATLLLTSHFSKARREDAKPLTIKEWGKFALWLKGKGISPADLLVTDPLVLLDGWHDVRISSERIVELLNRGHSLALAMEKWQRAGLWVVTRADPEYPRRLKQRLKTDSPPVLFGCGNKELLNMGGLAVIGSRNASDDDLSFTNKVGSNAAEEGIVIVSGAARGVDETAMLGAMNQGGSIVGVMADSLLKAATSSKWRKGLMDNHVVLVSPFYPEAGFSVGNAMARNKYIYCLSESALVIHSGKKGGTLSGAEENLKKEWVPLWVKTTTDKNAANSDLVSKGGRWLEANEKGLKISDLINSNDSAVNRQKEEQADLFSVSVKVEVAEAADSLNTDVPEPEQGVTVSVVQTDNEAPLTPSCTSEMPELQRVDFYQLFITELRRLAKLPVKIDELIESTGLHKSQLNAWLKRAEEDCLVRKLTRPVRYQVLDKH